MVLPSVDEDTMISTWSYSRLVDFEQCPLRAKIKYVDKVPEPERPLPPGKTEHANDRGTRVHTAAELFVQKPIELAPELSAFDEEFRRLRELYKQGKVSLEGEWGMDVDWMPTSYSGPKTWLRLKLDAFVQLTPAQGVVIDYKTGRKFGNEIKHNEQGQLYQLAAFLRYPKLQEITVEFWYTDQDDMTQMKYRRDQGLRFLDSYDRRGTAVTSATEFPAKPNIFNCKWCPYGPRGTGHCTVGV
jgi:RecB family exonuclease